MIDLEQQLRDLGRHLDHPSGAGITARVRERIATPAAPTVRASKPPRPDWRRRRVLVTALVSATALVVLAVAVPTTRDALAEILGVDASDTAPAARSSVRHHGSTSTTEPSAASASGVSVVDIDAARAAVEFPIRVPAVAGVAPKVTVDANVPGGMVALEYPAFTLVEVASPENAAVTLAPAIAPASNVRTVSVRGRPGLWITGTHHEIPFLDRNGSLRRTATRPTGHVLLWDEGGVTYRLEGLGDEASATEIARSLR